MSLSVKEGGGVSNSDLDALIQGDTAFLERIRTLQKAKEDHDNALQSLRLGIDAQRALQEAQIREATAAKAIDTARLEADKIVREAHQQADEIVADGHARAEGLVSQARTDLAGLNAEIQQGRDVVWHWAEKTRREAHELMNSAVAAHAAADARGAANEKAAQDLATAQRSAQASIDAANELRTKLNAKLEAIKSAAF